MFNPLLSLQTQYAIFRQILVCIAIAAVLSANPSGAAPQPLSPACGEWQMRNAVAPKDYRYPDGRLGVVEEYHFGPLVEALVRPMQVGMTFGADLNYTLFAYPNHHRALVTLMRLAEREGTEQPKGSRFTIDCFFQRATAWAPDDFVARMLYAQYLISKKRRDEAMTQLKIVVNGAGDNPLTHYNAGLLYLDLGALDEANKQAERAVELGYIRSELITELRKRGNLKIDIDMSSTKGSNDPVKAAQENSDNTTE